MLIVVFILSNCIVAKGSTKDADKLYNEAYKAVNICEREHNQRSVNNARETIKKLVGVADWSIGEFSKKIDKVQHSILVNLVDGILSNRESPSQDDINRLRDIIKLLPVDSWKRTYSSALDVAQNVIIKNAVDAVNFYKKDKSNESKREAKYCLNELRISNNDEVSEFAQKLAKEGEIILPELKRINATKILEHDNSLYEYYGLTDNEYIIEVKEKSYEEISKCLGTIPVEDIKFNITREDGTTSFSNLQMIIEPSEKNKSALLVIGVYNLHEEDHKDESFLRENSKYYLELGGHLGENIKFQCDASFKHKGNKNLRPPFNATHDYKNDNEIFNEFISRVKEYEKLDKECCILPSAKDKDLDGYLSLLKEKGAINCKNLRLDVYGNYNEDGDSHNEYIYKESKNNSKSYRAFRNITSIKELQAVIDKIDKEIYLMKEQYSIILENTEDDLEYRGEKKISSIVEDIKLKAGIDKNNTNGLKIGFYEKGVYEPIEDVGYMYNSTTGDGELRNGDKNYRFNTELIVWKNGIVMSYNYDSNLCQDKWVTISTK